MKLLNVKMTCFTQVALSVLSVCLMANVAQAQNARANMAASEGSDVGKGADGKRRSSRYGGYKGLTYGERIEEYRRDGDYRDRHDHDRSERHEHSRADKTTTEVKVTTSVTTKTDDRPNGFPRHDHTCDDSCKPKRGYRLRTRCSNVDTILKDARVAALADMSISSAKARETMLEGFEEAIEQFEHSEEGMPLTELALYRGLELNDAFQGACDDPEDAGCFDRENRAALFFLQKYVSYVTDTVTKLDNEYFIPYLDRYDRDQFLSRRWPVDLDNAFLVKYAESASALLGLYNGQTQGQIQSYLTTNKYELEVVSRILYWVSEDLDNDLMKRDFECLIFDTQRAAERVARNIPRTIPGKGFRVSGDVVDFARDKAWVTAHKLKHLIRCGQ